MEIHSNPNSQQPWRVVLYTHKFNLRVDDEMANRILEIARKEGRPPAAVMRDLIEWGLEACA